MPPLWILYSAGFGRCFAAMVLAQANNSHCSHLFSMDALPIFMLATLRCCIFFCKSTNLVLWWRVSLFRLSFSIVYIPNHFRCGSITDNVVLPMCCVSHSFGTLSCS